MQVPLSFPSPAQRAFLCASFGAGGRGAGPSERLLGKRVLIVEDEALLAFELEVVFNEEGAEVLGPALSLASAQALVETAAEIDCAVLDVDLGGHNVFPVALALQARGVPILFHTARVSARELTASFPGSQTVPKPARPEDLVARLAGIVR
jgi:DNA-binding response OmpR family regulator